MTAFSASSATSLELPRVVQAVRTRAPHVPADIRQRALEATAKFVQLARKLFGRHFPMPTVAFDLRGKTAGQAFLGGRNLIRYNAVLLVENEADFQADTIPHEVAHLIADQVYGRSIAGHGREWQSVMHKFGVTPRRTHDYDVTNSAVGGVHRYVCNCGTVFPLGNRKHKQAARGRIICTVCRSKLRPEGVAPPKPVSGFRPAAVPQPTPFARPTSLPATPTFAPRPTPPRPPLPPVARPTPFVAPPVASVRPATPAQLQYALVLANRLGIALTPEHVGTFAQCSAFIERHKVLTPPAAAPKTFAPSERQLQYARDIARRRAISVPADAELDSRKLSAWIDKNR